MVRRDASGAHTPSNLPRILLAVTSLSGRDLPPAMRIAFQPASLPAPAWGVEAVTSRLQLPATTFEDLHSLPRPILAWLLVLPLAAGFAGRKHSWVVRQLGEDWTMSFKSSNLPK